MKRREACQVHGGPSRAANRTLLGLIAASLALIVWHVWVYGPTGPVAPTTSRPASFPLLVAGELGNLFLDRHGILAELREVFPYFLVGILLAGGLRTYKFAQRLRAVLNRYGVLSVVVASFVGIVTPLCACGTLTTAVSLLFAGLPLAPVMSLLVTSPLLSPSTYLLTLNDLGPEWTVIRTIAALAMGIFAGLVTHLLRHRGFQTEQLFLEGGITRGDFHDEDYPDERLRCDCRERFGNRVALRTANKGLIFLAKSAEMLWPVGKYVLVGIAVGAIVERYLPVSWLSRLFGQKEPLSIVWVTLGSVPVFLHQISASSILAHIRNSLDGTLDGGAALALLIGGPVTAMPTMILFWSIFRKRVFCLYLFVCLAGTMLLAYSFQWLVFVPGVDTGNPLFRGVSSLAGGKSAIIRKETPLVRVALDPDGHATIATYSNDAEGHGGIVFDAGFGRLLADRYDNRTYLRNVAAWLGESSPAPTQGPILIYTLPGSTGQAAPAVPASLLATLQEAGFTVKTTDRRETPEVTERLLAEADQLWLLFAEGEGPRPLSEGELERIARFAGRGKGMLVAAARQSSDSGPLPAVNRLSSRYGVNFSGTAENGEEIHVAVATQLFDRAAEVIGWALKLVAKA